VSKDYYLNAHARAHIRVPKILRHISTEAVEKAGTLDSDAVIFELEKTDMPTPYNRLKFTRCHSPCAGNEYDPAIGSQWMDSEYRPCVFSNVTTFLTDKPIAYANLKLPTEEFPDWIIP